MKRTEIMLGRRRQDGSYINQTEFDQWLRDSVDPKLVNYTVVPAVGRWAGMVEDSTLLIDIGAFDGVMDEIAADYKQRFDQQEVLIDTEEVAVREI